MNWLLGWAVVAGVGALVSYLLFVFFYGTRSPWWSNPTGVSLLLSKFALVLLLSHLLIVLVVGDYPGRVFVWALIATLLWIAGTWQLLNLLRLQHIDRRNDSHERRRSTDHV